MLLNLRPNEKGHYWKHSTITHQHTTEANITLPVCLQTAGMSLNQDSTPHIIESDTGDKTD